MTTTNRIGLYVHFPFCIKKCRYCDFLSYPCSDERALGQYAEALIREIKIRYEEWPYRVVDSIFLGGGTPSLMPAKDMERVVNTLKENFTLSDDCEITIEANPSSLTDEKLETYLRCGINRISIGIQSFNNSILKLLGRVHDKNDGINAIRMAKKAGFENINVDMMFGIPKQDEKMWRDSLRQCIFLRPQHVSIYSLQLEEGTPLHKLVVRENRIDPLPEKVDRSMFHDALMMLEDAGYNHYEISNAALPGFESRHNMKYWSYDEYLGLGPGASSFIGGYRFKNSSKITEYLSYIKRGLPPVNKDDVENFNKRDEMGIYVFTGLRKIEGFNISDFEETFGEDFFKVYNPEILDRYKGLLEIENQNLKLTARGVDVSNRIMAEFV